MPLVSIVPTNDHVEIRLLNTMQRVRKGLKTTICEISGFPESDVLINLMCNPYLDPDPDMPDLVLYADTCPNEELEEKSELLCRSLAKELRTLGFTVGKGAEVWPRFLPGPWCLIKGSDVVEYIDHPRKSPTT